MVWLADSYEAIYQRAQSLNLLGDKEGAIRELGRMVERLSSLQPSLLARRPKLKALMISSSTTLSELLHQAGRYDQAIELKRKLTEWDGANRESWQRQVGALLIEKGEIEEGLECLRRLGEEDPKEALNWLVLGNELAKLGRLDEAQDYLQRAQEVARRREERAGIWFSMASLHRQAARYDQAAEAWEEMAKLDPEQGVSPLWVYGMYIEVQEFPKARGYLSREKNRFLASFYGGLIAWREGNHAGAERTWRMMVTWQPGQNLGEQETWAEACLRTGNATRVPPVVGKHLAENPPSLKLVLLLGIAQAAIGELEQARSSLGQLQRSSVGLTGELRERFEREAAELMEAAIADEALREELSQYLAPAEGGPEEGTKE